QTAGRSAAWTAAAVARQTARAGLTRTAALARQTDDARSARRSAVARSPRSQASGTPSPFAAGAAAAETPPVRSEAPAPAARGAADWPAEYLRHPAHEALGTRLNESLAGALVYEFENVGLDRVRELARR